MTYSDYNSTMPHSAGAKTLDYTRIYVRAFSDAQETKWNQDYKDVSASSYVTGGSSLLSGLVLGIIIAVIIIVVVVALVVVLLLLRKKEPKGPQQPPPQQPHGP